MALPGFLNFYSAPRIEVEAPSSGDDQSHWLVGENSYAEVRTTLAMGGGDSQDRPLIRVL